MNIKLLLVCVILRVEGDNFACEDDIYRDCKRRAELGHCQGLGLNDPYREARKTLAECRKSCREALQSNPIPSMVSTHGGLEDHVIDPFGFKFNLCAENEGFTSVGREAMLFQTSAMKEQPRLIKKFTEVGFEKTTIPGDLHRALLAERDRVPLEPEFCVQAIINCEKIRDDGYTSSLENVQQTYMMHVGEEMKQQMTETMLPLAEKWANVQLQHTFTYGIRRYLNGSWLASHLDKLHTHVISAILNVDQSVNEDWPLYIKDNDDNDHAVLLQPGEMLWYESARAIHGRPSPLNGQYFDNIFTHFKPVDGWFADDYQPEHWYFNANSNTESHD